MADVIILKIKPGDGAEQREEKIHVDSILLSKWSGFFESRYSGRWNNDHSHDITISEDEQQIYTDLFTGAISNTEQGHLLNILCAAKKYIFRDILDSPIMNCILHLRDGLQTKEQAMAILEFHGEDLWENYKSLRNLARDYLHSNLTDFDVLKDELIDWPVDLLTEFLATNDNLKIGGEYDLFEWLCAMEEKKAIRLLGTIRFALMSLDELDRVRESSLASKAMIHVSDAFRLMHRVPYKRDWSRERRYIRVPIRTTVDVAYSIASYNRHPLNRCTVLMSLTREDLQRVVSEGRVESHEFCFSGHKLKLIPQRKKSNIKTHRVIKLEGEEEEQLRLDMASEGDTTGTFTVKVYMRGDSGLMEENGRTKLVIKGGEETFILRWLTFLGIKDWSLYTNDGQLEIKVEIIEN